MFLLFTTPTCPNCPEAKKLISEKDLAVEVIDASTTEGLEKARKFHLSSVPSLVEVDDEENLLEAFIGIESISSFLQ